MTSPTQRSLKHLRDQGYLVGITEKWNPFAKIRQDLFGYFDMVAVHPEKGILGVQTTSKSNMSARINKARGNGALICWLLGNGTIQVHGWHKLKNRWVLSQRDISISDVSADPNQDFPLNG